MEVCQLKAAHQEEARSWHTRSQEDGSPLAPLRLSSIYFFQLSFLLCQLILSCIFLDRFCDCELFSFLFSFYRRQLRSVYQPFLCQYHDIIKAKVLMSMIKMR